MELKGKTPQNKPEADKAPAPAPVAAPAEVKVEVPQGAKTAYRDGPRVIVDW